MHTSTARVNREENEVFLLSSRASNMSVWGGRSGGELVWLNKFEHVQEDWSPVQGEAGAKVLHRDPVNRQIHTTENRTFVNPLARGNYSHLVLKNAEFGSYFFQTGKSVENQEKYFSCNIYNTTFVRFCLCVHRVISRLSLN